VPCLQINPTRSRESQNTKPSRSPNSRDCHCSAELARNFPAERARINSNSVRQRSAALANNARLDCTTIGREVSLAIRLTNRNHTKRKIRGARLRIVRGAARSMHRNARVRSASTSERRERWRKLLFQKSVPGCLRFSQKSARGNEARASKLLISSKLCQI